MLTEDMIRRIQGLDYPEEPETKYPLWFLGYGWPVIVLSMGLIAAACAVWRHFG